MRSPLARVDSAHRRQTLATAVRDVVRERKATGAARGRQACSARPAPDRQARAQGGRETSTPPSDAGDGASRHCTTIVSHTNPGPNQGLCGSRLSQRLCSSRRSRPRPLAHPFYRSSAHRLGDIAPVRGGGASGQLVRGSTSQASRWGRSWCKEGQTACGLPLLCSDDQSVNVVPRCFTRPENRLGPLRSHICQSYSGTSSHFQRYPNSTRRCVVMPTPAVAVRPRGDPRKSSTARTRWSQSTRKTSSPSRTFSETLTATASSGPASST